MWTCLTDKIRIVWFQIFQKFIFQKFIFIKFIFIKFIFIKFSDKKFSSNDLLWVIEKNSLFFFRYDYNELLRNSTFCLIPRGRRLGSFRFLESMKYGCIPVLLSNGWDLPYKDLIDWSKFSLNIDERNLLQLPSIIEGISEQVILSMRQQTLFIYKTYFSSVTSIFNMMLEVKYKLCFIFLILYLLRGL